MASFRGGGRGDDRSTRSIDDYTYEYASSDDSDGSDGGDGFVGWDHGVRESSRMLRTTGSAEPSTTTSAGAGAGAGAGGSAQFDSGRISAAGSAGGASAGVDSSSVRSQGSFAGFLQQAASGLIRGTSASSGEQQPGPAGISSRRQRSEAAANIGELPYGARPSTVAERSTSAPSSASPTSISGAGAASAGTGGGRGRMSRIAAMRAANASTLGISSGEPRDRSKSPSSDLAASSFLASSGSADRGGSSGNVSGPASSVAARYGPSSSSSRVPPRAAAADKSTFNASLRDAALAATVPKPSGSRDKWGADIIDYELPGAGTAGSAGKEQNTTSTTRGGDGGTGGGATSSGGRTGSARPSREELAARIRASGGSTRGGLGGDSDVGPGSAGYGTGSGVGVKTSNSPTKSGDYGRGGGISGGVGGVSARDRPPAGSRGSDHGVASATAATSRQQRDRGTNQRPGELDDHLRKKKQERSNISTTNATGGGVHQGGGGTSVGSYGTAGSKGSAGGAGGVEIKPAIGPGSYDDVRARIASRYSSGTNLGAGPGGGVGGSSGGGGGGTGGGDRSPPQQRKRLSAMEIARRASGSSDKMSAMALPSRSRVEGRPAKHIDSGSSPPSSPGRYGSNNNNKSRRNPTAAAPKPAQVSDTDEGSINLEDDILGRGSGRGGRGNGNGNGNGNDADIESDMDNDNDDDDDDDTSFEYSLPSLPSSALVSAATRTPTPLDVPGQAIGESWSVRIRLISAVDLPPSLTPHAPLCPLLKFGIVSAKDRDWYKTTTASASTVESSSQSKLLARLNTHGLDSIPLSRTRCSSHKILTPRDNGSMEWHEEMRWDDVLVTPPSSAANDVESSGIANVAVVVELCARSILDPPPPPRIDEEGGGGRSSPGGLRQNASGEYELGDMEKASRAVEEARMLMDDNDPLAATAVGEKHGRGAQTMQQMVDMQNSQPAKKKRKFASDLRLGSLVIPLTDLPLEDATHNRDGEAVVEKWFTLNSLIGGGGAGGGGASALPPSSSPPSRGGGGPGRRTSGVGGARRTPSVLLEISFSRPETLDESEDEADMGDDEGDDDSVTGGGDKNDKTMQGGDDSFQAAELVDNNRNRHPSDRQSSVLSSGDEMDLEKAKNDGPETDPITGQIIDPRDGPLVKPGVVDFLAVVGCRDIGDQTNDDGSKGWVTSTPECCILEQYPFDNESHIKNGRNVMLADKIEWFCFPEGCRLWRGSEPPTHMDLNLKRFSASSPPTMASSIAAFDACLNCTSTFTWFVMASNSDEYGSSLSKTYGGVIRFFVPAPPGIDRTQDDYAQASGMMGAGGGGGGDMWGSTGASSRRSIHGDTKSNANQKRLWVPMGILMTSSLPIVGVIEAMLLRLCETLASKTNCISTSSARQLESLICDDIANLIVNFSAPIKGVLHCSIPFLSGERFHLTLPPPTGLPGLPHGASVTSVCRLLGAEGLTVLLAAVLTEAKILIHSADVANLAMVAEVITALIYPFDWSLPYIPVLPNEMLEFIEAPLSYFLGVPSCNMEWIDKSALHDVVVIDCDNGFSSPDYFDGRRGMRATKLPTPLPASVSSNISKAVFRLLKEEEEVEEQYGAAAFAGRHLPRLEGESLAEREFRITVALQVCSLIRGYQECLFFVSASQPVFNRDRFLRNAPALFEERRTNIQPGMPPNSASVSGSNMGQTQRVLSPRSKRFLSNLVNTQHFHALLERLDHDSVAFFHEVMEIFDRNADADGGVASSGSQINLLAGLSNLQLEDGARILSAALEKMEHKVSTYRVDRKADREKRQKRKESAEGLEYSDEEDVFEELMNEYDSDDDLLGYNYDYDDSNYLSSFTQYCLKPIQITPEQRATRRASMNSALSGVSSDGDRSGAEQEGVHALSLEYLIELEKNPWQYEKIFPLLSKKEEDEEGGEEGEKMTRRGSMGRRGSNGRRNSLGSIVEGKIGPVDVELWPMVTLKEALGERRFRAWKLAQEQKNFSADDSVQLSDTNLNIDGNDNSLDLTKLLNVAANDADADSAHNSQRLVKHDVVNEEQQRVTDAKDRDTLRKCLEKAYEGSQDKRPSRFARRSSGVGSMASPLRPSTAFEENGVDLISEAEAALRNPSAQRFLVSVLSQRSRLETQRRKDQGHGHGARQRQATQSSVSRLQPSAFECLVRLCVAMLEACMEEQNYLSAYQLLTHTAGFCTVTKGPGGDSDNKDSGGDEHAKITYMTARIGIHPIFADLRLWERVMGNHLQDRVKDKSGGGDTSGANGGGDDDGDGANSRDGDEETDESDEYEAAVSTLYEMLGYGVPSEDLSKFATRISEQRGWFATERGQALLMLARRLAVKRDEGDHAGGGAKGAGDLDLMTNADKMEKMQGSLSMTNVGADILASMEHDEKADMIWKEVAYAHPAGDAFPGPAAQAGELSQVEKKAGGSVADVLEPNGLVGRAAVTSLASFGSNVVCTGGLDGSVFMAHTIKFASRDQPSPLVSGVRLEWGNTGPRGIGVGSTSKTIDGEFGVGAVSCLAAARGAGYRQTRPENSSSSRGGDTETDDREMLSAMDGCRVVAGTTGGDLRVWSVKDVYASVVAATNAESDEVAQALSGSIAEMGYQHTSGATSNYARRAGITGDNTTATATRLKYPLKGRALSGHRGGVTCLDVPSHIYRPDSLVSGGADGLIKLWSLRQPTGRRTATRPGLSTQTSARFGKGGTDATPAVRGRNALGTEAIEVLTGHGGKVLTVKTAWHGDRLLSGGADRTVRLWDLAGSGGKCLHTLEGHLGWVTQAHYWGPHTLVSASTDRSIALWDARASNAPLFVLRYHMSPISSVLVGSRTEFLMNSAGMDGAVATWDFRAISGAGGKDPASQAISKQQGSGGNPTRTVRDPVATMNHCQEGTPGVRRSGAVLLSKGAGLHERSVLSASVDNKMKEWDIVSGRLLGEQCTGHTDVVSQLSTFSPSDGLIRSSEGKASNVGGTITCSWDGTVRMKRLQLQY